VAKIVGGKALVAVHIANMGKTSNAASRAGRSRFQVQSTWMRPRSGTGACSAARDSRVPARSHPRKRGPCSTLRHAGDFGHNPPGRGTAGALLRRPRLPYSRYGCASPPRIASRSALVAHVCKWLAGPSACCPAHRCSRCGRASTRQSARCRPAQTRNRASPLPGSRTPQSAALPPAGPPVRRRSSVCVCP
jgi:hypothetical protein